MSDQTPTTTHKSTARGQKVIVLLTLLLMLGADTPGTAVKKVREGLLHFRNQQFSDAETSFTQAQEIDPENAIILFDKACAALAGNDADQARGLFRSASLAKAAPLAAKAHYNLGCLEADQAREKLGENPAAAEGEVREECVELLRTSIRHYRDVLRLQPDHKDARHNLELIRMYIKHLQSQWAERDKQKDREEKDLLQFLKMIEDRQKQIRSVTKALDGESNSAYLRQAALETAESLRTLHEEIDPLKEKITQQIQAAEQQQQQPAPGQQPATSQANTELLQAEQMLHQAADQIGTKLLDSAIKLEANDFVSSMQTQTSGLEDTNKLYMTIAPYQDVLQRALGQQQSLAPPEEEPVADSEVADQTETAETDSGSMDTEATVTIDPEVELEGQNRITEWSTSTLR